MYLTLYDTLTDDDEEVRDIGATVVSWVLSPTSSRHTHRSLVPLAASCQLSDFLAENYPTSRQLFLHAIHQITGQPQDMFLRHSTPNHLMLTPVHQLLSSARIEDTSLFAEEKQNLFVDELREAAVWFKVLGMLSSTACDPIFVADFTTWTADGLSVLSETARNEVDGPLGWTSKVEVFILGMRVIFSAHLIYYWSTIGTVSVFNTDVLEGLRGLKEAGESSCLHEMWAECTDYILTEAEKGIETRSMLG